jgi:hypothetical protein
MTDSPRRFEIKRQEPACRDLIASDERRNAASPAFHKLSSV